jgi:hypothetical protein
MFASGGATFSATAIFATRHCHTITSAKFRPRERWRAGEWEPIMRVGKEGPARIYQVRDDRFGLALVAADTGEQALLRFLCERRQDLTQAEIRSNGCASMRYRGKTYTAVPCPQDSGDPYGKRLEALKTPIILAR